MCAPLSSIGIRVASTKKTGVNSQPRLFFGRFREGSRFFKKLNENFPQDVTLLEDFPRFSVKVKAPQHFWKYFYILDWMTPSESEQNRGRKLRNLLKCKIIFAPAVTHFLVFLDVSTSDISGDKIQDSMPTFLVVPLSMPILRLLHSMYVLMFLLDSYSMLCRCQLSGVLPQFHN